MKLLFTGHRGFLGRELIPLISDDCEILTWEGDYTDRLETLEFINDLKVQRIIHAAARGGRRTKSDSPNVLINNLLSSLNILEASVPSILFCSGAIYDRRLTIDKANEESSNKSYPSDYYGQSKFLINQIAKAYDHAVLLRFFNVFGKSEGLDRFISFNVSQYIKREPMVIYRDFEMDFFSVADVAPIIRSWLHGRKLPKEINLVYEQKFSLTEICNFINQLDSHKVSIEYLSPPSELNYTGKPDVLKSLEFDFDGLRNGIREMYKHFLNLHDLSELNNLDG